MPDALPPPREAPSVVKLFACCPPPGRRSSSLSGTADFQPKYPATGVRDQVERGRNYGCGFWSQQWLGLKRLAGKA